MKIHTFIGWVFLCAFCLVSCKENAKAKARPSIAVTNSYLECAAGDIAGNTFDYIRLVPPGMCPGHFDISPGFIRDLKTCSLVLRFDFQKGMDDKILPYLGKGVGIEGVVAPEGLCVPGSYRACLKETHKALCLAFPREKTGFDDALEKAFLEIESLEKECGNRIKESGLLGESVIASGHQEVFCRWLGLDVAASYSSGNTSSLRQLEEIIQKGQSSGVRFIIANLQEGEQQARALSAHLGSESVVFSNFPDMSPGQRTFLDLVRYNIDKLIQAATNQR